MNYPFFRNYWLKGLNTYSLEPTNQNHATYTKKVFIKHEKSNTFRNLIFKAAALLIIFENELIL